MILSVALCGGHIQLLEKIAWVAGLWREVCSSDLETVLLMSKWACLWAVSVKRRVRLLFMCINNVGNSVNRFAFLVLQVNGALEHLLRVPLTPVSGTLSPKDQLASSSISDSWGCCRPDTACLTKTRWMFKYLLPLEDDFWCHDLFWNISALISVRKLQ